MEILFLGTGSAWGVPEHACECAICSEMRARGEERTRTSFLVRSDEVLLVDCGPDLRRQMIRSGMECPDAVLITHEHGDHFLGLDDLLPFRRSVPVDQWKPLPVYATEITWKSIEARFGYLLGSLMEKRLAIPGKLLEGLATRVTPFKTFHGPSAPGSVGYAIEESKPNGNTKLVYTSDFLKMDEKPILMEPSALIMQVHWLYEPRNNRPYHMSFQRAIDYIRRWNPIGETYLVHMSAGDLVPGDPKNNILKKLEPVEPMVDPTTGEIYPIPRCQDEWQTVVNRICRDYGITGPVLVAEDGMKVKL